MLMTTRGFELKYEEIMRESLIEQRDRRLADLMTEMERVFGIPFLNNKEWEKGNPNVINLYRKISASRTL